VTAEEFLGSAVAQGLLNRARRAAGTPLSVHQMEGRHEAAHVQGRGGCRACLYVNNTGGGAEACMRSRSAAGAAALRHETPAPFICHMGFACVSVSALAGHPYVLCFGPYVPAGEAHALEHEVLEGLAHLRGAPVDTLPFTLDDLPVLPAPTVIAVAEFAAEALQREFAAMTTPAPTPEEDPRPPIRYDARAHQPEWHGDPYQAGTVAAALAAGHRSHVRELLRGLLAETAGTGRMTLAVRRARVLAAVSAALEAAERARLDTAEARGGLAACLGALEAARDDKALLDAAVGLLARVGGPRPAPAARRSPAQPAPPRTDYAALNAILTERLVVGIELGEVAEKLGEKPTTISKRLKRKFGMSYQEYLGRLRINKAKEMLRRTKLSATEVAQRVGIGDQSNFTKLFKKFEGLTPSEYRARFGK
jgi:AraC-like DNA-binding protein